MIEEVKAPVFAESIAEGTLLDWRKTPGEAVSRGETLVEIETDKVVLEVSASSDGVLQTIRKQAGETVQGEELLGTLNTDGKPTLVAVGQDAPEAETGEDAASDGMPLSPAVRRLLNEHDLDPERIPGTGKDGRLTKTDVQAFMQAQAAKPTPAPESTAVPQATAGAPVAHLPKPPPGSREVRREPMSRLRSRVAERLVQVQQQAAILTTFNEVNMGPLLALRARYKERFEQEHGVKLGFMSFFTKAAVLALQHFPAVNAYIDAKDIEYHEFCDVGIAVSSPRGLVVPVLRNAETMSFADIESSIRDFAERAKSGRLGVEELTGGTFTITNGGVFGSMLSTPIINPPQSAILGMHKTQDRPVAEDGQVVIRPIMYLALSYDHRIIDGREAVQFLVSMKESLEDPGRMLLEV